MDLLTVDGANGATAAVVSQDAYEICNSESLAGHDGERRRVSDGQLPRIGRPGHIADALAVLRPDAAVVMGDDLVADGQPHALAADLASAGAIDLVELLEDRVQLLLGDADANTIFLILSHVSWSTLQPL